MTVEGAVADTHLSTYQPRTRVHEWQHAFQALREFVARARAPTGADWSPLDLALEIHVERVLKIAQWFQRGAN